MKYFLLVFSLCAFVLLNAQNSFDRNDNFIVLDVDGNTMENPWAGGFNSVQFSEIDLDLDGIKDLFVFDRTGNRISTFINSGLSNQVAYTYAPEYISLFPSGMTNWVLLRDFNCDGKMDIFASSGGGVKVYKNISSSQLTFALEKEELLFDGQPDAPTPSYTNLFINTADIPAIDDIDNDGDLDILRLSLIGNRVEYLKNLTIEKNGSCDSLDFQIRNKCWGFIEEFTGQNKVVLYDTCASNNANPEKMDLGNKHLGGSAFFTLDVDANGSKELVIGGSTFNNLLLLINSDFSADFTKSSITNQQEDFPASYSNTIPVEYDQFLAGYYLDINNDGVKDLITSTNALSICGNSKNVWTYLNANADNSPDFNYLTNSFLQEGMIEVGSGAHPSFVDYNADGKMDIVIGNFGLFDSSVPEYYVSSLWLYENVGTIAVPEFQLVDSNYVNISSMVLDLTNNDKAFVLAPSFGDIDGDGDQDMLLGDFSGNLHYFENTAGAGNQINLVLNQAQYLGIDVGKNAAPQIIDLNRDNLLDLVIGKQNGYISYYENTGTSSSPVFTLITDSLGMVNTKRYGEFSGNSAPFVYDLGGSYKILSGAENGFIYQFGNIDGNLTGTFSIDSAYQNLWNGINSTIAMADINNDNLLDLLIGNMSGGLALYTGNSSFLKVEDIKEEIVGFKVFPNPSKAAINIDLGKNKINGSSIQILNSVGELMLLLKPSQQNIKVDVSEFSSGMYFVIYSNGEARSAVKIVKE